MDYRQLLIDLQITNDFFSGSPVVREQALKRMRERLMEHDAEVQVARRVNEVGVLEEESHE